MHGTCGFLSTDHVSSLAWTQVKFWERGLPKPGNLTFVPLDLDQDHLAERLVEFGFDACQPAFLSALGVTQYLERGCVERLLRSAAALAKGSEIVFSYVPHEDELTETDRAFSAASAARVATFGEPWRTGLERSKSWQF